MWHLPGPTHLQVQLRGLHVPQGLHGAPDKSWNKGKEERGSPKPPGQGQGHGKAQAQPCPGPQAPQLFPGSTWPPALVGLTALGWSHLPLATSVAQAQRHRHCTDHGSLGQKRPPGCRTASLLPTSASGGLARGGKCRARASSSVKRLWGWEEEGSEGNSGCSCWGRRARAPRQIPCGCPHSGRACGGSSWCWWPGPAMWPGSARDTCPPALRKGAAQAGRGQLV